MFNKIKSVLLPLAVFALFVSPSFVQAQVFEDVPENTWYFTYVQQLVADGVVQAGGEYRPDDTLTRAELAEMVILATSGLSEYVAPEEPTFIDVPLDSPYFNYVEAAVQLDIVSGLKDVDGNLMGVFSPDGPVNRATAAKILTNAFDLPVESGIDSVFPDVPQDAWFYDFVVSVYNQSIIDGYDNGFFGPADPITRAQMAKLIVNAQNPLERVTEIRGVASEEVTEIVESNLHVSANPYQSPPLTAPRASATPLVNVDFTASGSDVLISEITLTRSGVGDTTDFSGIYLYQGNFKITSEYTVAKDTNKVSIPVEVFVPADETITISAYADTAVLSKPLNQHRFYVESAADIISDAEFVTGDFPAMGNTVTIGNLYANTLLITPGITPTDPARDQHSEIASFKLEAGSPGGDVALNALALTQAGSFDTGKMTDCSLLRESDVVATAAGFYGDKLIFVFEAPYVVPAGQKRNFYVECFINGGRTTDTIHLYLEEIYDLLTTDMDYGFSAAPLNYYKRSMTPSLNLKGVQIFIQ